MRRNQRYPRFDPDDAAVVAGQSDPDQVGQMSGETQRTSGMGGPYESQQIGHRPRAENRSPEPANVGIGRMEAVAVVMERPHRDAGASQAGNRGTGRCDGRTGWQLLAGYRLDSHEYQISRIDS